ncbi:PIR protein [Plasmodium yoelii]|uniref:PIR protein n=2 Tax=Plasmodium yoelii TaxID=5861 RepID=A0AAF0B5K5_PLAYO|nr:PIR protein [Plasmodium yoelii]WBY58936.1 PIR protein [Plasmodium yoelii yoelii]CDS44936.1 YIR protein [Plasmodium yoelii]VTZ79768.1 PIR protein [Plasmodium yoelii]|eukprot:XP_022812524.1 PIR protein [Plasmodium yoelii]
MAISKLCQKFDNSRKGFPDKLNGSGEYDFKGGLLKKYCPNNQCESDTDKINAGCLGLFIDMFGTHGSSFSLRTYKDEAACILIWLGYILTLKPHNEITSLMDFYSNYMQNYEKYTEHIIANQIYKNYKEIIDAIKEYMNIDISNMAKFYELLKLLCDMNSTYTKDKSTECLQHANKFVDEYRMLLNDDKNIDNSTYSKVLRVVSNYYNNFEKGRDFSKIEITFPTLPTKKTTPKVEVEGSDRTKKVESLSGTGKSDNTMTTLSSNTTLSSSSILNKIIPVLSIFGAIAVFLGISYKYSLFGFRKRSQKHLREKLKK